MSMVIPHIPALLFHQVMLAAFPDYPWMEEASRYLAYALLALTLTLTVYSGYLYVVRAARILIRGGEE